MMLYELSEKLKLLDEVTLMEVLELTSEDIVDAFMDRIEDNYNRVIRMLNEQ